MRGGLGHYGGSYNLGNFGSFHNADDIFRPEKDTRDIKFPIIYFRKDKAAARK